MKEGTQPVLTKTELLETLARRHRQCRDRLPAFAFSLRQPRMERAATNGKPLLSEAVGPAPRR
ncbi:MAG: hypothetical protein ACYDC1_17700 [Limisphaerales bacterium]